MRFLTVAALALAVALGACGGEEVAEAETEAPVFSFTMTEQLPADEMAKVKAALDAMKNACAPLFQKHWKDVTEARVKTGDPTMNYTGDAHGWTGEMWVEIDLADDLKTMPADWRAWGHTLHYVMGGGREPGFISKKAQGSLACGLPENNGADIFKPDSAFQVLADLKHQPPVKEEKADAATMASGDQVDKPAAPEWHSAAGNIWPGVHLFYGPARMPVGQVVDFDEAHQMPSGRTMRGVLLRMKSGSMEWKDRDAIALGPWFVRADDPALR